LVNSIGLPNKGLRGYLDDDLPELARLPVALITNVMGSTAGELCALVEALDARDEVDGVELNVSCPNVSTGLDIGADPGELAAVLGEVRPRTAKPLIVKLTPNTADVAAVAQAAQDAGADAVSLINTLRAYAPHPTRAGAAWLGNETGGLSGPGVRAVAHAQVRAVAARVSIPVIGMGGVQSGLHAAQMLEAGATLVAVGTESFRDPAAGTRISRELDDLFAKSGDNLG
jgi:dihydroorotate dehydrogenase (NAD+) catalytic subunit